MAKPVTSWSTAPKSATSWTSVAKTATAWTTNPASTANLYAYDSASHTYDSAIDTYDGVVSGQSFNTTKLPTSWTAA